MKIKGLEKIKKEVFGNHTITTYLVPETKEKIEIIRRADNTYVWKIRGGNCMWWPNGTTKAEIKKDVLRYIGGR